MFKHIAVGVIISLSIAFYWLHDSNTALRQELADTKAAQVIYKKQQQAKIEQVEQEHEQATSDITDRYNSILKRLRDYESSPVRTVTIAAKCESERSADASRMQSELLRSYANVARYADELNARGLACEKLNGN